MVNNWLITGDWHIDSRDWLRRREFNYYIDLILKIKEKLRGDLGLIVLGDIINTPSSINMEDLYKLFSLFSKIETILVIGNHDTPFKDDSLPHLFKALSVLDTVYTYQDLGEYSSIFSIYNYYSHAIYGEGEILLSHKDIIEFNRFYDSEFTISIKDPELSKYRLVFNGHLHSHIDGFNYIGVGSPYPTNLSDHFQGCVGSFVLYNIKTNTKDRYYTNITKIYHDTDGILTEDDLDNKYKFHRVYTVSDNIQDNVNIKVKRIFKEVADNNVGNENSISDIDIPDIDIVCESALANGLIDDFSRRIISNVVSRQKEAKISSSID